MTRCEIIFQLFIFTYFVSWCIWVFYTYPNIHFVSAAVNLFPVNPSTYESIEISVQTIVSWFSILNSCGSFNLHSYFTVSILRPNTWHLGNMMVRGPDNLIALGQIHSFLHKSSNLHVTVKCAKTSAARCISNFFHRLPRPHGVPWHWEASREKSFDLQWLIKKMSIKSFLSSRKRLIPLMLFRICNCCNQAQCQL